MNAKSVRNIRKLEKPRPLKLSSDNSNRPSLQSPSDSPPKSASDVLSDLESLHVNVNNGNFDETTAADITKMCSVLKRRGEELDSAHKEQLDHFFITLRNVSREDRLDMISRIKLLEIIELRAMRWKTNDNVTNFYKSRIFDLEQGIEKLSISGATSPIIPYLPVQAPQVSVASTVPLAPGEILRSSGKFVKPTKIAGKNYFKDEIIIRNSDSGKVNPGARDRLVQITGPHEEAIGHAKLLVEDTIRRNASPIREKADVLENDVDNDQSDINALYGTTEHQGFVKKQLAHSLSMGDTTVGEYTLPVQVGQDMLRISGTKIDMLKTAKLVLIEYFAGQKELHEKQQAFPFGSLPSPSRLESPPIEENAKRFDLRRQSSLKNCNSQTTYSAWMRQSYKKNSPSPFSSSDDENTKPDSSLERSTTVEDFASQVSAFNAINDLRTQELSSYANSRGKFSRSSSVPNDVSTFQHSSSMKSIRRPSQEEQVLSPVLLPTHIEVPSIPPPCYKRQKYSREFLLHCAKSSYSHTQPANYVEIHKNYREIICESPVMFDPTKYLKQVSNPKDSEDAIN